MGLNRESYELLIDAHPRGKSWQNCHPGNTGALGTLSVVARSRSASPWSLSTVKLSLSRCHGACARSVARRRTAGERKGFAARAQDGREVVGGKWLGIDG